MRCVTVQRIANKGRAAMNWYLEVLKKYAEFKGRARRKEYWMFFLINLIIAVVIAFVEGMFGSPGIIGMLYSLAVLLPAIGVTVRRLHDTDRTGWWILVFLIPLIGWIVLLVFMVLDSQPGDNEYGPNPKPVAAQPPRRALRMGGALGAARHARPGARCRLRRRTPCALLRRKRV